MNVASSVTIQAVARNLAEDLKSYLEAQYHIRDESILNERRALLDEPSAVAQRPFVEATPSYELSGPYGSLGLPERTRKLLTDIVGFKAGIYERPYVHQAKALQAFLAGKNILAATGTGSGKTEIFLLSILSALAEESNLGNSVTSMPGCRALILYPMNALVSDQLARLRVLFGNTDVKASLKALRGRVARFGMYTSRTPFPGLRPVSKNKDTQRNKDRVSELWRARYKPILDDPAPEYLEKLKALGKWPAKDVARFFGSGKWDDRLNTTPDDVELLMRHEMQEACPDLLVTNYSMLEYMLVRPIERSMFEQTAAWLKNPGTFFTIVLDEAHLYRGATGAEVSFLLRRLISRLGVKRDRIRFILTTASVGPSDDHREKAIDFACDLTGIEHAARDQFEFIVGTQEKQKAVGAASQEQAVALESFNGTNFQMVAADVDQVRTCLEGLGQKLGWGSFSGTSVNGIQDELYRLLAQFPPAGQLLNLISGQARDVDKIAEAVFPDVETKAVRDKALDSLLRICNYAKEEATGKVFLPARLHLFFRGLSGLYACVDPQCPDRRQQEGGLIGRLFSEPRVTCRCGARVFELFTDRECGAPFLQGYVRKADQPDFVWHEPTTEIESGDHSGHEFERIQLHLSKDPPRFGGWQAAWMQVKSGRLEWTGVSPGAGWTRVFVPDPTDSGNRTLGGHLFRDCPSCGEAAQAELNRSSKIMDMRTKGEQPFGQLVKGQFLSQSPDQARKRDRFPNQGRKVLLFSDGRQKAAKLAKDIPNEVELDSFRELLALGFSLNLVPQAKMSLAQLYPLFVAACDKAGVAPYAKQGHIDLKKDIRSFVETYEREFDEFRGNPPTTLLEFKQSLYKQVSGGLYSMRFICAGWIWPMEPALRPIRNALNGQLPDDELRVLAATWMQGLAKAYAIDKDLPISSRQLIAGGYAGRREAWGHAGRFGQNFRPILETLYPDVAGLENHFRDAFTSFVEKHKGYFLNPQAVCLRFDLASHWFRCSKCLLHSAYTFRGHCPGCGSKEIADVDPQEDRYIKSRKGYWRKALDSVFQGKRLPSLISAEEHTAQLTHSDPSTGVPLVEDYELRFRDIIRAGESPVDVLSCTTTMEVGIDIGSLVAVGLRNVPPQRENYQQRAGRAGRRGSSVSSVVTYCQGGAHDNHYYAHVADISSGPPRPLRVKVDNEKIAKRHVHAYILQEYFATQDASDNPSILSSLGTLDDFFAGADRGSLGEFESWVTSNLDAFLVENIAAWVRQLESVPDLQGWVRKTIENFVDSLKKLKTKASEVVARETSMEEGEKTALLAFCLSESLLPTYAFPTNLATFRVEVENAVQRTIEVAYAAQQSAPRALTEYAPGRFVTIDKNDYQSAVVTASVSTSERARALPLFNNPHRVPYVFCKQPHCCYVENVSIGADAYARAGVSCPLCKSGELMVMPMISPQIYMPKMGKAVDEFEDDPEFTRASPAQFPVPLHSDDEQRRMFIVSEISPALKVFKREQAELVVVNKGDSQEPRGFAVCDHCGLSNLILGAGGGHQGHKTPYVVSSGQGGRPYTTQCQGQSKEVFLGHRFSSDLSILRAYLTRPMCQMPLARAAHYVALQDSLQTLAEALSLGAARHFDVDHTEFSSGYRLILQAIDSEVPLLADLYIFDTLAGGAGYSQQLGACVNEVLRGPVTEILECRMEGCDRSCYKCIRHYHNQINHDRLDRKVALDLLSFLLDGAELRNPDAQGQESALLGLREMLRFYGFSATVNQQRHGFAVPLLVSNGRRELAVYATHPLVAPNFVTGLQDDLDGVMNVRPLNGYYLSRNLPACFLEVKRCLEQ